MYIKNGSVVKLRDDKLCLPALQIRNGLLYKSKDVLYASMMLFVISIQLHFSENDVWYHSMIVYHEGSMLRIQRYLTESDMLELFVIVSSS